MLLQDVRSGRGLAREVATVRFLATILFRAAQRAGRVHPMMGYAVKQFNHLLTGADLAWQAYVGPGVRLFHPTGVVWGPGVVIGENCVIQQGVTLGTKSIDDDVKSGSPRIGSDVQLGSGCKVIGGVKVGDRCVIGANSVVTQDLAPSSIAVGVPARVIRRVHVEEVDSDQ